MSGNPGEPFLYQRLRLALGIIYSLHGQPIQSPASQREAHDFLVQFQARNIRRKLRSFADGGKPVDQQTRPQDVLEPDDFGSTWLASLALLAGIVPNEHGQQKHHIDFAEALFASQTLLHRSRRVKPSESIDIEFEPPISSSFPQADAKEIYQAYLSWIEQLNPAISRFLQQHVNPNDLDEERVKGQLTLMTVMPILYQVTLASFMSTPENLIRIRPLLTTLASLLAVTAGRLRYTTLSVPNPAPNTKPVVGTILHALHLTQQFLPSSLSTPSQDHYAATYLHVFYTCMSVVPDAILAPGRIGGTGTMSIDPRCFTAVTTEVRSHGIEEVCESLSQLPSSSMVDQKTLFLYLCEEWARHAPLPQHFVEKSLPIVQELFQSARDIETLETNPTVRAALRYWIAIMESGSWTIERVLASSLIQKQGSQQPNKKKQSNKSKKRQKELLDNRTSQDQLVAAEHEVRHRGMIALQTAMTTWDSFQALLALELDQIKNSVDDEVRGDGPVGCLVACANTCLPFTVREYFGGSPSQDVLQLFASVASSIQQVCGWSSRYVREFAVETLFNLHAATLELLSHNNATIRQDLQSALTDHFYHSSLSLAVQCAYPTGYFLDLGVNNDDELERERNNVRDILRTMSSTTSSEGKTLNGSPCAASMASTILFRLLQACADPILSVESAGTTLFAESAIHTFSALARPLIATSKAYSQSPTDTYEAILTMALRVMSSSGQQLVDLFPSKPMSEMLPLSRLFDLAAASLAPMLGHLYDLQQFATKCTSALDICIQASIASLYYIPELAAPSSLRSTRYDIRGAMRTPGGEDHAGVLSLVRLATENKNMAFSFIRTRNSVGQDLCLLYQHLKGVEVDRGRFVFHGKGVLPKSRRILLGVICHLEKTTNGEANASSALQTIFEAAVNAIASMDQKDNISADDIFVIAENVFDIAAFSPEIVKILFDYNGGDDTSSRPVCLRVLEKVGNFGFQPLPHTPAAVDALTQWNRLRAALFCLVKVSGTLDLPSNAVPLVLTWISEECRSINDICSQGPMATSPIFHDDMIEAESIPTGLFLHAFGETLDNCVKEKLPIISVPNCIHAIYTCKETVLNVIVSRCPNPFAKGSFSDPRPTVAEAWILLTIKLIKIVQSQGGLQALASQSQEVAQALHDIIVDTFVSVVTVFFYPSLGKTNEERASDPGFSMDGPHMLVSLEFLATYFDLGSTMLQKAATELIKRVPVDGQSIQHLSTDPNLVGIAIVGAAIFRIAQGALPPWAVESMPMIYSSFYGALERNTEAFILILRMAMFIRIQQTVQFGGVGGGKLLSGRFFDTMGDKAKHTFISQATENARANNVNSWKKMKTLVKQACGGKKKDTDFKQRPALTKLDSLDRV